MPCRERVNSPWPHDVPEHVRKRADQLSTRSNRNKGDASTGGVALSFTALSILNGNHHTKIFHI